MRSKKAVYTSATLAAMVLFLPFRSYPWALYLGVCAGYSVLVFGLRRIERNSKKEPAGRLQPARVVVAHSIYLAVVIGWVWLLLISRPRLPYILRTEDTSHPYFGLVFLGVLGVLGIEYFEQRYLQQAAENETS